jgi:ATP-dependent DNA helicase RecG
LLNKAEYNFLDFKFELSDNNERIKEHINAFGNLERGGCLVFGVENYVPKGTQEDRDSIIQKITNIANHGQEPSLQIHAFPIHINNKNLLCIHILSSKTKPVFIKDRAPLGGKACFKRTGSSTVAMSTQEIKDLLISYQEIYFDESPVKNTSISDLDFNHMSNLLPKLNQNHINTEQNTAVLLDTRVLVGVKPHLEVSSAGWLCFAIDPQQKKEFRNSYIEFQIFKGNARDNPIRKYEIKGNLPHQIEQSIQLLKQYIWLVPTIEGIKREDIPAYPDVVLREVITNSVVHRDYRKMHHPVKIAMFDNRIEIENPGGLMPGLTIYNLIHRRDWRNPLLAELMKKFGFGDMDGQGIDRLYAATLRIKVPPPIFIEHDNSFTIILSAPKSFDEFSPEEKRLMVIIIVIMHEYIDNKNVRNCFGISAEKASTLIKSLVADKILQPGGTSRKYAKYILTDLYRERVFG